MTRVKCPLRGAYDLQPIKPKQPNLKSLIRLPGSLGPMAPFSCNDLHQNQLGRGFRLRHKNGYRPYKDSIRLDKTHKISGLKLPQTFLHHPCYYLEWALQNKYLAVPRGVSFEL